MSDHEERLRGLVGERSSMMRRAKILSFVPHEKQMDLIEHDTVKRKAGMGANRSGKTAWLVIESACHAWGCRPFFPKDHPHYRVLGTDGKPLPVPNVGMIAAEDFPVGIAEGLWPTFLEWLPPDSYQVVKHERSTPRLIHFDVSWCPWADRDSPMYPYSHVYVHAYVQGRSSFQSVKLNWAACDEPMPEDIYEEIMRALLDMKGKFFAAMTVADASRAWIYDLFMPPKQRTGLAQKIDKRLGAAFRSDSYYMVPLTTWDNVKQENGAGGLDREDIEEFAAGFSDPEKVALRVEGKPPHLLGTEYGKLWDPTIHVVPDRERDPNACFACFCDAHPTKPFAIVWFEINEHDEWHVWAESYDPSLNSLWKVSDEIKRIEEWRPLSDNDPNWDEKRSVTKWIADSGRYLSQVRYIDPIADMKQKQGDGLTDIEDFAFNHGILWSKWNRGNLAARIRTVKDWLEPGSGPHARPKLTIAESCLDLIYQMPRFREKMPRLPSEQPRTGAFLDVDADLVQCVIAAANCGLGFQHLSQIRDWTPRGFRRQDRPAGRIRSTSGYHGWAEQHKDEPVITWARR